jgi:hypothetical protein
MMLFVMDGYVCLLASNCRVYVTAASFFCLVPKASQLVMLCNIAGHSACGKDAADNKAALWRVAVDFVCSVPLVVCILHYRFNSSHNSII